MPRFVVFLTVAVGLLGGIHYYFWLRLVRDTQLPIPYRPWASAALVGLCVAMPVTLALGRRLPVDYARLLAWPAYIWLGVMFLLFLLVTATDLVRLATYIVGVVASRGPAAPERRMFLARVLGSFAGLTAGALGGIGVFRALSTLEVKDIVVELPRLPASSHGTTIVQITDVHIGPTIGRAFIEEVVRRTNALQPDIIAITGDLVDGSVERLRDAVAPLADLRARHGVFFVTGNHEYFSGVEPWLRELQRLGIRVLRNERVAIGGEGDQGFDLAGVHDYSSGRNGDAGHSHDLPRALAGVAPGREVVLLAHQPRSIHEAARLGVGLQLSGHTHGGQIWPWGLFVKFQQPYIAGLHRHDNTFIYVSDGTGYWGPPMRLGTTAEITRITLMAPKVA